MGSFRIGLPCGVSPQVISILVCPVFWKGLGGKPPRLIVGIGRLASVVFRHQDHLILRIVFVAYLVLIKAYFPGEVPIRIVAVACRSCCCIFFFDEIPLLIVGESAFVSGIILLLCKIARLIVFIGLYETFCVFFLCEAAVGIVFALYLSAIGTFAEHSISCSIEFFSVNALFFIHLLDQVIRLVIGIVDRIASAVRLFDETLCAVVRGKGGISRSIGGLYQLPDSVVLIFRGVAVFIGFAGKIPVFIIGIRNYAAFRIGLRRDIALAVIGEAGGAAFFVGLADLPSRLIVGIAFHRSCSIGLGKKVSGFIVGI